MTTTAQRIVKGFPYPMLVNETNNNQAIAAKSILVNQTQTAATVSHKLLPLMGVG